MSSNGIDELKRVQLERSAREVLTDEELQTKRYSKLIRAMQLWNSEREKSKIVFKVGEEIKSMDTEVWLVSEKYVCINEGLTISEHSILDVIN